jgi:hypothetical protein
VHEDAVMPRYTIEPTQAGAYDVTVREQDGTERVMRGLPNLHIALEWIASLKNIDTLRKDESDGA